jgi:hypothetical protein
MHDNKALLICSSGSSSSISSSIGGHDGSVFCK